MSVRRRRKDQESLNVPTATGDTPNPVGRLARAPTHDQIAQRAYELFEERGGEPGREWEDWFRAERESWRTENS
jgi:hypothetical protein